MQLGTYVDGRPVDYDEETGAFSVGGTSVTVAQVRGYSTARQIGWLNAETAHWFDTAFPIRAVPTPTTARGKSRRRPGLVVAIVAIVIIVGLGLVVGLSLVVSTTGPKQIPVSSTVTQIVNGSAKAGEQVRVRGVVVAGSWNRESNPTKFTIKEEADTAGTGPTIKIVYSGTAPNTLGDGVVAIVTGTLDANGVIQSNEMMTKRP